MISISANSRVHVRLNDYGERILQWKREEFYSLHPDMVEFEVFQPKMVGNGRSEWTLWYLMSIFGEYIAQGRPLPFDMLMEIEEK